MVKFALFQRLGSKKPLKIWYPKGLPAKEVSIFEWKTLRPRERERSAKLF